MVDALRRATRWMQPDGCILDVHPTPVRPPIEVGGRLVGFVDAPGGPTRHTAADAALQQLVTEGLLVNAASETFDFATWADTIGELQEHIEEHWRDARVVLQAPAAGRARAVERVRMTRLVLARRPL